MHNFVNPSGNVLSKVRTGASHPAERKYTIYCGVHKIQSQNMVKSGLTKVFCFGTMRSESLF